MAAERIELSGRLVDIPNRRIFSAQVVVEHGVVNSIRETSCQHDHFLLPGFVDSHVHIESSMLVPSQFARVAAHHGTVATVADPHEIANVLGMDGVRFMLDEASTVPLKFCFGAPSCVPATEFETAGAEISAEQVAELLDDPRIGYLSEMMNYPGILSSDPEVMAKLKAALDRGKPVDGHAPGLRGEQAKTYFSTGISTDHECFTKEEALEKIGYGARILIREGSAARNFDELRFLIDQYPNLCMFCSDDKHPDDLLAGHIDEIVRRSVAAGLDLMNVLQCACVNPVEHYQLNVGQLRIGDPADLIEVDNLKQFRVLRTFIEGQLVATEGRCLIDVVDAPVVNNFHAVPLDLGALAVPAEGSKIRVIEATDGQLITRHQVVAPRLVGGLVVSDTDRDILKMVVVNRYEEAQPAVGFVRNFGLKEGAFASSVAHDSHNVIAVGVSDDDLTNAINSVIATQGGLAVSRGNQRKTLPLPVAGLMSTESCEKVAAAYVELDRCAKQWGCKLRAPFTTLSFMALLVIPECKLSDRGLFGGQRFEFVSLFVP
ncbi:MAG: adenine deaminase [Planctomycetaceae bacterium]|nr:adenine deaminase [Planctomycetaceae bacterium]